jgi:murein DD-endopeptidase MepM/ murein hydrolase activator NlpD
MRVSVLSVQSGKLLRGVALGLIAGLGAGCSSDFSRFAPTSADYTGSINQQQIIHKNRTATQPFPENIPSADVSNDEPVYTGSVENGSIRPAASPVKRSVLAPVSAARRAVTEEPLPMPAAAPVSVAAKKPVRKLAPIDDGYDDTVTGTVEPAKKRVAAAKQPMPETAMAKPKSIKSTTTREPAQEGWSTIGGTWITVKEGETVYNLAKRFGVPANAILEANKLPNAASLQSGQKVIIPTYIYSNTAKISAPDANAETLRAKSTTGTTEDVADGKAPQPKKLPARENVAVLPAATTLKTKQTAATTTAAAAKPKAAPGTYTVASGDSLYVIAKKHGTTVAKLKAANGLTEGTLKIGQVLKMPAAGAVVVAAADPGVDPIITGSAGAAPKKPAAATPTAAPKVVPVAAPSAAVMDEADKDTATAPSATGISKLRWPVRGRTLVGYGQADAGRTNDGVDISVPVGTPVKAAENGVVIYAGTGLKDFGNTVLIRHENGLVTVYGHNGDLMVKRGETIKRGQEIARSGMSGSTKVPKLHFEVRKNSKPVNPVTYLE